VLFYDPHDPNVIPRSVGGKSRRKRRERERTAILKFIASSGVDCARSKIETARRARARVRMKHNSRIGERKETRANFRSPLLSSPLLSSLSLSLSLSGYLEFRRVGEFTMRCRRYREIAWPTFESAGSPAPIMSPRERRVRVWEINRGCRFGSRYNSQGPASRSLTLDRLNC